jgi:hypothetical protein
MLNSRELEVIMAPSLRTLKWKIILMKNVSSMSFRPLHSSTKWGGRKEEYDSYRHARTMLDEYKTFDRFWAETVNKTCHATNRLYLHKLFKKTPYKLLTSNKSNVSYFRDFESKCYALQKRSKSSKFAPKVYERFLLGYDSNLRAYCVFNKDSSCVKTRYDAVFDETSDSQVEQYDLDVVDDKEAPYEAL